MSRASASNRRDLSLTEELEKLEQSITLTLQEIDHNFSRAHRIVTTSILPIVEQYAEHSKNVWEGSKFWKQFFEASANVSLSGYEELAADDTVTEDYTTTDTTDTSATYASSPSRANDDDNTMTADTQNHTQATYDECEEDSLLDSLSISPSHITPRATNQTQPKPPAFAQYPSPYETLKREVHSTSISATGAPPSTNSSDLPSTPGGKQKLPDMSLTPTSSPFAPPTSAFQPSTQQRKDMLLHRVLDKNYRLQATPHAQPRPTYRNTARPTTQTPKPSHPNHRGRDSDSPMSSPPIPAPVLHSEIFDSPQRRVPPRTPGVSVLASGLTPRTRTKTKAKHTTVTTTATATATAAETSKTTGRRGRIGEWDTDSDFDDDDSDDEYAEGMSPPKTMQFHVPQSRLLRTPAREASKRIVQDILRTTAGGGGADDNATDELDVDLDVDDHDRDLGTGIEMEVEVEVEVEVGSPSLVVGLSGGGEGDESF